MKIENALALVSFALILTFAVTSCGELKTDGNAFPQRFEWHRQNISGAGGQLYRLHDKQTGKDYLAYGSQGGLTEIEPMNKERNFDK